MNTEQTKSLVRWIVTAFGATAAGFVAGKGWATAGDVLGALQSDTFIQGVSALASLIALTWSLFRHTEKNQVVVTDKIPEVAGVITVNTPAGQEMARVIPSPTVAPAGSRRAEDIAVIDGRKKS